MIRFVNILKNVCAWEGEKNRFVDFFRFMFKAAVVHPEDTWFCTTLCLSQSLQSQWGAWVHSFSRFLCPPPLEKGGILFCNCVSIGLSTKCCPLDIFWPFTWSMQGLTSMCRWSFIDFQVTCSKVKVKPLFSTHSYKPSVLSAQYLLTPSLDQYQT